MSINGVSNPLLSNLGTVGRPATGTSGTATRPGGTRIAPTPSLPTSPSALKAQPSLTSTTSALPAEAPAGTDPALWSVLTTEERTFFAKASAMGPLTYGRVAAGMSNPAAQAAPAVRGGRLDVRA
jgi:hypothetical protein